MLKNYILVALRNLTKNKFFSLINITGLALGIAASLLMLNYLRFERSYDTFHANADRIYRVPMTITEKGAEPQTFAFTFPAVANAMKAEFPEVEAAIRIRKGFGLVKLEDTTIPNLRTLFIGEDVFTMFSYSFLYGNKKSALAELNSATITRTMALQLFGTEDARGKTFTYGNTLYEVSAVIEDVPENSHLQFDILLPYKKYVEIAKGFGGNAEDSWGWSDFYTYVLLKPGTDVEALRHKLIAFAELHKGEDMKATGYETNFQLQPLTDIHTKSNYDYEFAGNGNYTYLDYVAIASFFILFMAWLNYINLSTSRSLERSKEVGIRKSVGAYRLELIKQFLLESLVINVIAIAAGIAIMLLATPYVSNLIGKPLSLPSLTNYSFWGMLVAFLVIGAVVSGAYPAFVLSSFKPFQALKGIVTSSGSKATLRKAMVVGQVALALLLIAGTVGLVQQVRFMRNQDLGVNINQTLVLQEYIGRDSSAIPVIHSFMNEVKQIPAVQSVTAATDVPGKEVGSSGTYHQPSLQNAKRCRQFYVDQNYFSSYELPLIAGRNFSHDQANDTESVILNETAVSVLGFASAEDAIDKIVTDDESTYRVIGVIKDYHQESLQFEFNPTLFFFSETFPSYYSLKVATTDMPTLVAAVEQQWKQFFPDSPFTYFFLDEFYNAQYQTEQTFEVLLTGFTVLGVVVACLGLLGLSSFTVAKRTKEVGIRKVLGANVGQLVVLLTKEYLVLVSIAFVIALPLAQYLFSKWLEGYAFRVSLGVWFFILPFALIITITLVSVGLQSFKAAWVNPVKSLRSE